MSLNKHYLWIAKPVLINTRIQTIRGKYHATGRSHTEKRHHDIPHHFHTAPFPFPLCWVFIPTCVASPATKPYLESKSRDSASSLVCLITNQSAKPSLGFSILDRCNCWPRNLWQPGFGACRSCDTDRWSLFVLSKEKRRKRKKSTTRKKIRQLS